MLTMVIILCRGNDFRVAYAHLGELRSVINENVNVMALTATATKETYETVCLRLSSGVSKVGHGRAFALPTAAESNFNTALKPFK